MSETLSLSGIEYSPAKLVGKRLGYSGDYVAKLAREGQVLGTKVGNQWFVVESSVKDFFEHKTKEKNERNALIRVERQKELADFQKHLKHKQKSVNLIAGGRMAALETLVILVVGLSIGASGYVMTSPKNQTASIAATSYGAVERLAVAIYSFITGGEERSVSVDVQRIETEQHANETAPAPTSSLTKTGTTTHTSLVIAPGELFTATTVDEVRDSLSDDVSVSVDPENPDTGIIIPHFQSRDGDAYRFLLVPLREAPIDGHSASNANGSVTSNQNGG